MMKSIFNYIFILFCLAGDTIYNTAMTDGRRQALLAIVGGFGTYFLVGNPGNVAIFAVFVAMFAGGFVRMVLIGESPCMDRFADTFLNNKEEEIEDITHFLMGADEDEIIDLEKSPFKMGSIPVYEMTEEERAYLRASSFMNSSLEVDA